jgi:hypothetical protein
MADRRPETEPRNALGGNPHLFLAAAALAAFTATGLLSQVRDEIHPANAALVIMLVVVGAAMGGGRGPSIAAATVGALSFNFFFTPPYLTLRIADAEDLLTFVLLLVGGLLVSQLAHVAAARGERAARRRLGVRRLHELSELALHLASAEVLLDRACTYLIEELGLQACDFEWGDREPDLPDLDHRGVIDGPLRHAPGGFELPREGVALPVRSAGGDVLGRFHLTPRPLHGVALVDREVALLVADLLAPALDDRRRRTLG